MPLAAAGADGWTDQDFEAGFGVTGPGGAKCDPSQDPTAAGIEARIGGACWNVPANATLIDLHLKSRVDTGGIHGSYALYDAAGKRLATAGFCDNAGNLTVPVGAKVIAITVGAAPAADCAPGSTPAGKVYIRFRAANETSNATTNASVAPSAPTPATPTPSSNATPDVSPVPERVQPAQAPASDARATPGPGLVIVAPALAMGFVLARRR